MVLLHYQLLQHSQTIRKVVQPGVIAKPDLRLTGAGTPGFPPNGNEAEF